MSNDRVCICFVQFFKIRKKKKIPWWQLVTSLGDGVDVLMQLLGLR